MKKDNILKLRQELLVLKTLNIKPNYSELSRLYGCDRRTVQKYNNGYSKENLTRDKTSKLDKYKEDIKNKLLEKGYKVTSISIDINNSDSKYGKIEWIKLSVTKKDDVGADLASARASTRLATTVRKFIYCNKSGRRCKYI